MQVYGDAVRCERACDVGERLEAMLREADALPHGLQRHQQLVAALIEAGELAQALEDGAQAQPPPLPATAARSAMVLVHALARSCARSWRSAFADGGAVPFEALAACRTRLPPIDLVLRCPEGYAFYALYPEGHFEAARALSRDRPWRVIGVRSIGTSLAAMVSVGLGAGPPDTVRPQGHPFERRMAGGPSLAGVHAMDCAVVDEGPGLSGSSMAAVAHWLLAAGACPQRLHFFPSHAAGPGPAASPETRRVWSVARVHLHSFESLVLHSATPGHRLENWFAPLLGALREPLHALGGGAWRAWHRLDGQEGPPVHAAQERRKYLARTDSGLWLLKFVGLGRRGECRFARARELARAGFVPEVAGYRHGFMAERWRGDLAPLQSEACARWPMLPQRMGEYLGFRARHFAAPDASGATLHRLFDAARANTGEALGPAWAEAWSRWQPALEPLERLVRRVETDNRMHAWEWLAGDGLLLKTDAVDHHAGHDLVGCQDIAWDVVGAAVEFGLSAPQAHHVAQVCARVSGQPVHARLLWLLHPCYLAFQLGYYRMALAAGPGAEEIPRLTRAAERYASALREVLASDADTWDGAGAAGGRDAA